MIATLLSQFSVDINDYMQELSSLTTPNIAKLLFILKKQILAKSETPDTFYSWEKKPSAQRIMDESP